MADDSRLRPAGFAEPRRSAKTRWQMADDRGQQEQEKETKIVKNVEIVEIVQFVQFVDIRQIIE